MTAALLTNGRYHVLSGGLPHPGQCAMCSEANRSVVTFSFQIPRYGTFMMCVECFKSCVRDLSPVLGFVSLDDFNALSEKYQEAVSENGRYRDVFESVGPSILALVSDQLASAGISVDGSVAVVDSPELESKADPEPDTFFLFEPDGRPTEDIFGQPIKSTEAD